MCDPYHMRTCGAELSAERRRSQRLDAVSRAEQDGLGWAGLGSRLTETGKPFGPSTQHSTTTLTYIFTYVLKMCSSIL